MKNSIPSFLLVVSILFLSFISNAQYEDGLATLTSNDSKEKLQSSPTEPDYSHLTHLDWGQEQSKNVRKVTQEERLLQIFLENKYLETILEKDNNGDFLPLTIISNNLFDKKIELEFDHKKVTILDQAVENNEPIIRITKYKIRKKKAVLEFNYKDEKVKIQLKKVSFNWEYRKLQASNNSGKNIDVTY